MKTILTTLLLVASFYNVSYSQDRHDAKNNLDQFIKRVTTDKFPPIGSWKDVKGKEFNFNDITGPTIIRIGHRGCPPCKFEMKSFIELSKKYSFINFIYLTYDNKQEILDDIKQHYPNTGNMRFISIPKTYIDGYRLVICYPFTYFVTKGNNVLSATAGGQTSDESKTIVEYTNSIDSVFRKP